jgi:hypothetical protein
MRRIDHHDAREPHVGNGRLRHELLVRAAARRPQLRVTFRVPVLAPHVVLAHLEPLHPRAPRDHQIDDAEREAEERHAPAERPCGLGHDERHDSEVPGRARQIGQTVSHHANSDPSDDDARGERPDEGEEPRARPETGNPRDGVQPCEVRCETPGRHHAARLHDVDQGTCRPGGDEERER